MNGNKKCYSECSLPCKDVWAAMQWRQGSRGPAFSLIPCSPRYPVSGDIEVEAAGEIVYQPILQWNFRQFATEFSAI
jgi:hypothetical protein